MFLIKKYVLGNLSEIRGFHFAQTLKLGGVRDDGLHHTGLRFPKGGDTTYLMDLIVMNYYIPNQLRYVIS